MDLWEQVQRSSQRCWEGWSTSATETGTPETSLGIISPPRRLLHHSLTSLDNSSTPEQARFAASSDPNPQKVKLRFFTARLTTWRVFWGACPDGTCPTASPGPASPGVNSCTASGQAELIPQSLPAPCPLTHTHLPHRGALRTALQVLSEQKAMSM